MNQNRTELTTGQTAKEPSTRRVVWRLAWPTITEQCLNLTVGLNEVFLIGHLSVQASAQLGYDSALGLAAGSLGQFFTWIVMAAFNGVGIATTALVARAIGGKQRERAEDYARHGLLLAVLVGLLMAVLIYLLSPLLLVVLGAEGQLLEVATVFAQTTALGMPLFALLVAGNACLRGSGDTRTPLLIMLLVNAANIAVAWLFINGQFGLPTLGVRGAALGAVISWSLGATLVLARLLFGLPLGRKRDFRVSLSFRLNRNSLLPILSQGLPTTGEQWIFQMGIILFARMLVHAGTLTYAAHNAVITIDSISFLPGIGLGIANTVLVGQSLGAGKPEQAQLYALSAYKMGLVFMTLMGAAFFIIPEFFLSILVDNRAVIAEATPALRIAGLFDPLIGTGFILTGALRGAGDTRFPLYVRFVTSVMVRVGLGYLFLEVMHLGLVGARLAMGGDTTLLAALVVWRFRSGIWKTIYQERKATRARATTDTPVGSGSEPVRPAAPGSFKSIAPEPSISAPDVE